MWYMTRVTYATHYAQFLTFIMEIARYSTPLFFHINWYNGYMKGYFKIIRFSINDALKK